MCSSRAPQNLAQSPVSCMHGCFAVDLMATRLEVCSSEIAPSNPYRGDIDQLSFLNNEKKNLIEHSHARAHVSQLRRHVNHTVTLQKRDVYN